LGGLAEERDLLAGGLGEAGVVGSPAVPGAVRWPTTFKFEFTPTAEAPNGKNCGLTNWPAAVKLVAS
jgi:hypothetical protein